MVVASINKDGPSVGIFWGFMEGQAVRLAIDATLMAEAEPYGDFLTHPRGYYEVWEGWRSLGSSRLKKMNLPVLIASSEYDSSPRGRLVFDRTRELYVVYADQKLQSTIDDIVDRFGLVGSRTVVRSDAHYVS
jgi:hypothetical protein